MLALLANAVYYEIKQTGRNGGYMAALVETTRDCIDELRHTPPGVPQNDQSGFAPEAPGNNTRSFSFGGYVLPTQARFVNPEDTSGIFKPKNPTRPIDGYSGLPLPFVPHPNLPKVVVGPNILRQADWDHQYMKAAVNYGKNPILALPGARDGLRGLRVQWVLFGDHHNKWNNYPCNAPKQPGTVEQMAATMVFGLAGYIPRRGLQLCEDGFNKVHQSNYQMRRLRDQGHLKVECEESVIEFLRWYVAHQDLGTVSESKLEQFIGTKSKETRLKVGLEVGELLMIRATEAYRKGYRAATNDNNRSGVISRAIARLAPTPHDLLMQKLCGGKRQGEFVAYLFRTVQARVA